METKNQYLNLDGFPEYKLSCGCISTNIPGFGWTTILCDEHELESEENYFIPPKVGKFRSHQHN